MKIIRYSCPICYQEFDCKISNCPVCGFQGIEKFVWEFEDKELHDKQQNDELFNIYKFTKNVYFGKIPFEKDMLDVVTSDKTYVLSASGHRGLAIVDLHNEEKPVVADDGILAFERTKALIINTDEIKNNFLDESMVRILFIGPDVKSINGDLFHRAYLKYIFVDTNNKFFSSDNNVLFNKKKTKLILYPSLKNEEEYTVPASVKEFSPLAFRSLKNLKTLYVPKGANLTERAIGNAEQPDFKIIKY